MVTAVLEEVPWNESGVELAPFAWMIKSLACPVPPLVFTTSVTTSTVAVVTGGTGAMKMVYDDEVAELTPFVTLTANVDVAEILGIPEMVVVVPVVPRVKPAGSDPEARLQVNGPLAVVEAIRV